MIAEKLYFVDDDGGAMSGVCIYLNLHTFCLNIRSNLSQVQLRIFFIITQYKNCTYFLKLYSF